MKKVILTTAALVLVGGGVTYAAVGGNSNKTTAEDTPSNHEEVKVENESIKDFTEYNALSDAIDLDGLKADVLEDNGNKRVIMLKDDNGHPRAKSIFIKDDSRLKVIDFNKGKVFDDVIGDKAEEAKTDDNASNKKADEPKTEKTDKAEDNNKEAVNKDTDKSEKETEKASEKEDTSKVDKMDEYKTIADHVDVSKYDVRVVEDNSNKRIMLLNDDNKKPEYKTIYIKHKNMLKIIDLNGGLVYKGII